jgi:cytochrome c-type biogenesis protein CcmH/NrfG
MVQGPVGSPYPGKYVMFAFAALSAAICWRSFVFAARAHREQRMNAARGISNRPDAKKSMGSNGVVALVAGCLLLVALMAIYEAWPN